MNNQIFYLGDIVTVIDQIDLATETMATVKAVIKDDEYDNLFWIYLAANDDSLNTNYESGVGYYWIIRENTNPYIVIESHADGSPV